MNKNKKMSIKDTIINSVFIVLIIIGGLFVVKWCIDGVSSVIDTYNEVSELSSRVFLLEQNNVKIINKICHIDYNNHLNETYQIYINYQNVLSSNCI